MRRVASPHVTSSIFQGAVSRSRSTARSERPDPCFLDWGCAKIEAPPEAATDAPFSVQHRRAGNTVTATTSPSGSIKLTDVGTIIGTPAYMAPEQVRGDEVITPAVDIYALGGILFEILTLEVLATGNTTAAILATVLKGVDARARERAPHRDVPPELEAVCLRAVALDPRERFASARQMADAIEAYLSGDRDLALRQSIAHLHRPEPQELSENPHVRVRAREREGQNE